MNRYIETSVIVDQAESDHFLNLLPHSVVRERNGNVAGQVTYRLVVPSEQWASLKVNVEQFDLLCRNYGECLTFREKCVFTKQEYDKADLFVVYDRGKPCFRDEWKHPVQYDYTCAGSEEFPLPWGWQSESLKIKKASLPGPRRPLWATVHFEWGVGREFYEVASSMSFSSDIGYRTIKNPNGDSFENVFQLIGRHQLPEYEPETTGLGQSKQVSICGRSFLVEGGDLLTEGFFPVLDRDRVLDAFGNVPSWSFARGLIGSFEFHQDKLERTAPTPRPVVGHAARELLISLGGKKLEFVPITWKQDL